MLSQGLPHPCTPVEPMQSTTLPLPTGAYEGLHVCCLQFGGHCGLDKPGLVYVDWLVASLAEPGKRAGRVHAGQRTQSHTLCV